MVDKLKTTALWTVYIFVVFIGVTIIASVFISALAPTFYPEEDISGIKEFVNTFCVFLSFLSVGLGVYSIVQTNGSGKQANEILNSIQAVERDQKLSQELMRVVASVVDNGKTMQSTDASKNGVWKQDKDVT